MQMVRVIHDYIFPLQATHCALQVFAYGGAMIFPEMVGCFLDPGSLSLTCDLP